MPTQLENTDSSDRHTASVEVVLRKKPSYPVLDELAQTDKQSNNSEDSGVVDWKDPKSVVEKNRHMLESQLSCDVIFYVGEKREKLGAHRYVLMTRSDVFLTMLSTEPEKSEFEVPDISADYFWEVLRHVYCEEQKLMVISVVGILAAADRYKLCALRTTCLEYLHNCLETSNACYLLVEVRKHSYKEEEKTILTFIRKNANDVFLTPGIILLSKDLFDLVMTLPGLDVDGDVKQLAKDKWKTEHDKQQQQAVMAQTETTWGPDPLADYLYVEREDAHCHRYILDSVTTDSLFGESPDHVVIPPNVDASVLNDVPDGMSTIRSTRSNQSMASKRSSVHTYSRLPSCNMWPEMETATRLQEVHGSAANNAKQADAISFKVDHDIYLFGFGIYGPKNEGEGRFKIDTVLTRKKRDIILESIRIRGAGVMLPVLFERPIKIDKNIPYTLETYITGPESHQGSSGQSKVMSCQIMFQFSTPEKVKNNRSNVNGGQLPRLLFMPRDK